jgi:hypothetical protein
LTSFDDATARSPITGALVVDVLGTRATVLAGELFGISKSAASDWFPDTNKNANKSGGWSELFTCLFNTSRKFSQEIWNRTSFLTIPDLFRLVPLADNRLKIKSFSSSCSGNTSRNTNNLTI